jgi:parallel beta-helix repeat protein
VLPQRLTSGSCFVSLLLLTTPASAQTATPISSSPGWHDVTRYGGKGDGIADDAAAISAAARALPQSGGVLYFPPGHYSVRSPIVLRSGVSLRGAGMGVSRISQPNGANLSSLVSYPAASFVTVSDLTFDGNKAMNATRNDGLLNFENSADVIVKNCEFKDAVGHSSVGVALRFGGDNKRILIDGNYVHDAGMAGTKPADGIYFGGSSVRIVNNLIVKASDTGIVYEAVSSAAEAPSDHGVIASNIVRNTPQGIAVDAAIAGTLGSTTAVIGNTVDGANAVNGASIFVFKGARGRAQSAVSVVGNIVRASTDGHGILLDGVSDVVINGNVLGNISTQKAKHGITVLRSKGISVVGNTIHGSGGDGISLQGVTDAAVTGNTVGEPNLAGVEGVGIDVRDQGGVRSDGVVVVANNVSGTKHKYGLQVADGATNLLAMGNSLAGAVRSFNRATAGRVAFSANLTPGAPLPDVTSGLDTALSASGEWRSLQLSDGGVASTTLRVAAAEPGDGVVCSHDQLGPRLLLLTCHVESPGVIRAILLNRSGGPIVVPAGTLRVLVLRRSGS